MAKVLVAFYNGVSDEKNPSAMPVFYEAFIQGLDRAGNQVMVYSHAAFGIDFGEIDVPSSALRATTEAMMALCRTRSPLASLGSDPREGCVTKPGDSEYILRISSRIPLSLW